MTTNHKPITDHASALAFLFDRIDYERSLSIPYRSRRFKLERMRQLASLVGNPERTVPAIHVAGTKGKGSTASMIAATLTAAGYRTGLYTSPHLHRLEERFVVDGRICREADLVALLADLQPAVQELDRRGAEAPELAGPTYFEITTAAALMYFQRQRVDGAVLEVGLGGRLDSTNICLPCVSVITTISLDHTKQLGKTLAKIAAEKAGIIKPGVPVVTGVRQQEPWAVIRDRAAEQASPLLSLGREFDFCPMLRSEAASPQFPAGVNQLHYQEQIADESWQLEDLQLGMLGRHQAANAAVALATLGQLRRDGWSIHEAAMRQGLQHARCPARCEIVAHNPTVILDAAHNPASVAALCDTLSEHFPRQPRLLIFAASVDKEVPAMLEQLLPCVEHVVVTRYRNNPRAMPPQQIADLAGAVMRHRGWEGIPLEVAPDPAAAWQRIRRLATPAHIVCVAGSFFLAAELREVLETAGHELAGLSLLSR